MKKAESLNTWFSRRERRQDDFEKWNKDISSGGQSLPKMKHETVINPDFTGIARSVECFDNMGQKNFRIMTLSIVHGKVTKIDLSCVFEQVETLQFLESSNHESVLSLNNSWRPGKVLDR